MPLSKLPGLLFHFLGVSLVCSSSAWLIEVDTHSDQCFVEYAENHTKLGLSFEVVDGGFLDIDVTIKGPGERMVYSGLRETSGKYTFSVDKPGKYHFCFSNKMSTITPKWVMFNIVAGPTPEWSAVVDDKQTHGSNATTLQKMITQLSDTLQTVQHEQEYLLVRTIVHGRISEYTNRQVVRWSLFGLIYVLFGVLWEAWYIKRFFEVRRVV